MESAKQERKNLMKDMPVDRVASGGSWMSKHSQSKMASPLNKAGARGNHPNHMKEGADNSGNPNAATASEYWRVHQQKQHHAQRGEGTPSPSTEKGPKKKEGMMMKEEKGMMMKGEMKDSPAKMKSPMEKELVGKQKNLPEALKAKIEAAPEMKYKK